MDSGPAVDAIRVEPRGQPVFEGQPPDLPEVPGDRVLLVLWEISPIAGHSQRSVHVGVDEIPADALKARNVVSVDEVDPVGTVLPNQGRPLIRALTAADDQDARAGQSLEVHKLAGVRGAFRR